jgi:hypothetical protein
VPDSQSEPLSKLARIPPVAAEGSPRPDAETALEELELAKAEAALSAGEKTALAQKRHIKGLEKDIARIEKQHDNERNERVSLQSRLDKLVPHCSSLETALVFDKWISVSSGALLMVGNVLAGIGGFRDSQPYKEIWLTVGLSMSIIGGLLVIGVHRLLLPKPNDAHKNDSSDKSN